MKKHNYTQTTANILISILITLFFISAATIFTVHFRPLYYWNIKFLHLSQSSGYSKDIILSNYNALIDYCVPFHNNTLTLPTFTQSDVAVTHFEEVKHIFNILFSLSIIIAITLVPIFINQYKKDNLYFLKTAAIMLLIIPLIAGISFIVNFDWTFTMLHKILFRNDYWLFNPSTDPIITILPESFFMQCGVLIILIQLAASLCLFRFYKKWLSRKNDRIFYAHLKTVDRY